MAEGFTSEQQTELVLRYSVLSQARQLLLRAGFPAGKIPDAPDASAFWFDVDTKLKNGVMHDGARGVLVAALVDYPANPVFLAAAAGLPAPPQPVPAGAGPGSPPPMPTPTPAPQPGGGPPAPAPNGSSANKGTIWAAVITAAATVIAALIAVNFFVGGDNSKPPSVDLLDDLAGKRLAGAVNQDGISDYTVVVDFYPSAGAESDGTSVGRTSYSGVSTSGGEFTCENDLYAGTRKAGEVRLREQRRDEVCYTEDELRIFRSEDGQLRFEVWMTVPQPGVDLPTDRPFAQGKLRIIS